MNHKKYFFTSGHSALSDKSAILRSDFRLRTSSARPQSSLESPDFSSQILECQAESSLKDSVGISESPAPKSPQNLQSNTAKQGEAAVSLVNTRIVCGEIQDSEEVLESTPCHSEAIAEESTNHASRDISAFTKPQYDKGLESPVDSESTPAVGHSSTAIESHSGDKRSVSPTLEASSGWGIVKGEGATSQFKPLPLNKKEKEILKNNRILEVKAKDSEKVDLESKELKSRDISAFTKPQYDKDSDFKSMDCHDFASAKSRNDKQTESAPLQNLQSPADSITATKSLPKNLMDSTRQDTPFQILGVALLLCEFLRDFGAGATTIGKHPKTSQIPQRQLSILRFLKKLRGACFAMIHHHNKILRRT